LPEENSGDINSFTESPCGYDKWNINQNFPFSFFGHNPKRLTLKFLQGLSRNGLAILPD
jgi:hypothetical protein